MVISLVITLGSLAKISQDQFECFKWKHLAFTALLFTAL